MPRAQDVSNALSRIRGVLAPKKDAERASRDIRLGLQRIVRVLPEIQTWQGVHVGGTNGKGSICAFLSGLFTLAGVGYGRYVSPAFPEKYHAVSINGRYVNPRVYEMETRHVESAYRKLMRGWRFASSESPGPLSPFELETAVAFRVFNKYHVPYGIVEVGMGGASDATNAMRRKAVTVISKIDLDHQEYLGNTIEEIAKVKAGIMRPGVPCIVDHTNDRSVINVLRQHASSIGTQIVLSWKGEPFLSTLNNDRWQLEDYQLQNLQCAALAFRHLFPYKEINLDKLLEMDPWLPGRMEWVEISRLTEHRYNSPVLVDAAHNMLGVQALARYTDAHLREDDRPVTWVMGFSSSKTKPFAKMIEALVRPKDKVAFVEFGRQENEPLPTPALVGRDLTQAILEDPGQLYSGEPDIKSAMEWATANAGPSQIVVTGSLYLVRDFYGLEGVDRFRGTETKKPGPAQLWRLSKQWRQRPLTKDEYEDFQEATAHRPELDLETPPAENEARGAAEALKGAIHGDAAPPRANFEEVRDIRRQAAWHEQQLAGYQAALRSIQHDVEYATAQEGAASETLPKLQEHAAFLRGQVDQHREAYERAADELRNHPDAPRQYALTHSEIFGRPPKWDPTPFRVRTELDPEQPVKKEEPTPEEEVAPEPEPVGEIERDFWGRPIGVEQPPDPGPWKKPGPK